MHLFSLLSNFETPQIASATGAGTKTVELGRTRSDSQRQVDELYDQLVTRYTAGETVKALAAELGLHHRTVRTVLLEAGALVRTRQRLAQSDVDSIVRLYEAGLTTTEIGQRFGVYASTIQRQLKRGGIALRPASRRPKANREPMSRSDGT